MLVNSTGKWVQMWQQMIPGLYRWLGVIYSSEVKIKRSKEKGSQPLFHALTQEKEAKISPKWNVWISKMSY